MFNPNLTTDKLNEFRRGSLAEHLGIAYVEIGADYLKATMPVDGRTRQPFGALHGGASLALAEEVGSMAANLALEATNQAAVGLEINGNHVRSATTGLVTAIARPLHIGRSTQVWEIKIYNDKDEMTSVCRLTVAVAQKK